LKVVEHKSSKTIEIYTHADNKDISRSPLDSIQIGGETGDDKR
jgi:hypothetical protein